MSFDLDPYMVWLIVGAAAATYATRIGGYALIGRMKSIPPRMEAALNAVPAAVLTTLFAPAFFNGGWDVKITLIVAMLVSLKYPGIITLAAGWAAAMICRHLLGL
jgi:uncharacterized membrane protein